MQWLLRTVSFLVLLGNTCCLFKQEPRNPEAYMNREVISYWADATEEYEIVTEDGYSLTVYRIPRGKNDSSDLALKPVLYLRHRWTLTAGIWIANAPNSLGFLLADAGCDVWMGKSRGNVWQKNLYLDKESKEFLAFSYDEMIQYDLPATIDFILKNAGQKQIYYTGHSQGTIKAFGAFSTNPQLAHKTKINFALGPVTTLRYTSAMRTLAYILPQMFK
uniref:Tear acid lipase-like protein n=1 Tax=Nannospalax galili TaxID=1026970 RepID=A0A8C6QVQ2_NANGA